MKTHPIKIAAIQSVCLALYNAAIAEFFVPAEASAEEALRMTRRAKSKTIRLGHPMAILDVAADSSSLIIAAPNLVRHRSLPIGTSRLDRALMSKFNLTREQAQQLRHQPTTARWMYQVSEVVDQVVDELARDLHRTLAGLRNGGNSC